MLKKLAFGSIGLILLVTPIFASAQTTPSSNASLIAVLTQLVQILEQELQQLIAAQESSTAPSQPTTPNTAASFTAMPTSGTAPLTVEFHINPSVASANSIDFGDDKTNIETLGNGPGNSCGDPNESECAHTYTVPGTYTAHIYDIKSEVLGTATITVGGNTAFNPVAPGIAPTEISRSGDFSRVKFGYYTYSSSIFYVQHGTVYDLPEADPSTFTVLSGSIFESNPYAIDKNHVYYLGSVIAEADPQTFHVINGGEYAVDNHAVYWEGSTISRADLATFTVDPTDFTQAQDENHLYCGGNPYPLGNTCSNILTQGLVGTTSAKPTASIWAVPTSVSSGSASSVFWNSTGTTNCTETSSYGTFSHSSLSGGATTGDLSTPMTYTITCTAANGQTVSNSTTVTIAQTTASPSATIDQSSLSASNPGKGIAYSDISGTASNVVQQIIVTIQGQYPYFIPAAYLSADGGRWSIGALLPPPGSYPVQVTDNDPGANNGIILATSTLIVH